MEELRQQLQNPDLGNRIRGILALRPLAPEEAIPLLELVLGDPSARVRYSAVSMLGQKPTPQTRVLLTEALFHDPEFDVRAQAAASLGDLGDPEAFEDLAQAYREDPQELVRFSVVAALGELGDPRAFDILTDALSQGGLQEEAAIMALGQLPLPQVVPALIPYLTHPEWQLRLRAVQALGTIGSTESLAALQGLHDENPHVAQCIALFNDGATA
ncbi:HEAT repeat domain-containing protein [Anthocerotibacter panamensis]|uniref:HEAT repeat domain-containing protein n=1 Tax=Anthocerotibacter panamensis TaxID=2857077 RepID=UPI001C407599|nr:HEAT repeat domain-containing protein [Anthocerotibacter panamensis]